MFNGDVQSLCAAGCGFFGSAPLSNMCSVCFKRSFGEDEFKRRMQAGPAPSPSPSPILDAVTAAASPNQLDISASASSLAEGTVVIQPVADVPNAAAASSSKHHFEDAAPTKGEATSSKPTNRCSQCSRKVGLTGFGCRCGGTFCSAHRSTFSACLRAVALADPAFVCRYSDRHACTFDYKAAGREALAAANPVVVADRVTRI